MARSRAEKAEYMSGYMRKYRADPINKAKKTEYMRVYYADPTIKAQRTVYMREYDAKRSMDPLRKAKKAERSANPIGRAGIADYNRWWRYKVSRVDYDAMWANQDGLCAGCGTGLLTLNRAPHVDHDHSCCSGKIACGKCVRGLLCSRCNIVLGQARDNPDTLRRLADYLERRN